MINSNILTRKIDAYMSDRAIKYLKDHIEFLVQSKNIKSEKDDSVFHIHVFIEDLQKREISYPASERVSVYLEFRKRYLINVSDHSEFNTLQIKELDVLFEYFNSGI